MLTRCSILARRRDRCQPGTQLCVEVVDPYDVLPTTLSRSSGRSRHCGRCWHTRSHGSEGRQTDSRPRSGTIGNESLSWCRWLDRTSESARPHTWTAQITSSSSSSSSMNLLQFEHRCITRVRYIGLALKTKGVKSLNIKSSGKKVSLQLLSAFICFIQGYRTPGQSAYWLCVHSSIFQADAHTQNN